MKIPVLASLYYTDLWPEFLELFLQHKDTIVPYMGLCKDNDNDQIVKDIHRYFPDHRIEYCDNAGADVMPFLLMLKRLDESVYPYFIKIHSKKSSWGIRMHVDWRNVLIHDLLGSPDVLLTNINIMQNDDIGMISNKFLKLDGREHTNADHIKAICGILNIDYHQVKDSHFPAGNMFMSKTGIFKKYFNDNIIDILVSLLSYETGRLTDLNRGTYSHALERIFGYIIKNENKEISNTQHSTIEIITDQVPENKLNLIVLNNDDCYIEEDINIYGNILNNNDESIIISWRHLEKPTIVEYDKISHNTIQRNRIIS